MIDAPIWIRDFFNSENRINLNKILDRSYSTVFLSLLEPIVISACKGEWPIFLPLSSGDRLWFYGIAKDTRELMELKRVLESFLGSADVNPDFRVITRSFDPSEVAILKKSPHGFIRFTILDKFKSDEKAKVRIFETLGSILKVCSQKPILTSNAPRPTGRVLRDFFTSCQIGDGASAYSFLDEIKGSGVFSHRNLLFLEIQAAFSSKNWMDVIQHKSLSDILGGRVPKRIFQILLRSFGGTGVGEFLQNDNFKNIDINIVRVDIECLSPLFQRQPPFDANTLSIDDWKLWTLGAASLGNLEYSNSLPSTIDADWIIKLNAWAGIESSIKASIETEVPFSLTDLGGVKLLLNRALVANKNELKEIYSQISSIPLELKSQMEKFPMLLSVMESISIEIESSNDQGWSQWFVKISSPKANLTTLSQELQNSYLHWDVSSFNEASILEILRKCSTVGLGSVFRDILPLLIGWLDSEGVECSVKFWLAWLELLALDDYVSTQDILLAEQLIIHILRKSYSTDDYLKLIEPLELIWDKGGSPTGFAAALDLMETLLDASCPDKNARMKFWQQIQSFALSKWNRLEVSDQYLTKCISAEVFGESSISAFPVEHTEADSNLAITKLLNLNGKLVGIYTLTEGAARRAKAVLENMFYGVRVELNHDHTATLGLTNLAKKADYFIFSSASSKHQAFYPVTKIRSDLIYPQGKGASSIVNAFLDKIV